MNISDLSVESYESVWDYVDSFFNFEDTNILKHTIMITFPKTLSNGLTVNNITEVCYYANNLSEFKAKNTDAFKGNYVTLEKELNELIDAYNKQKGIVK